MINVENGFLPIFFLPPASSDQLSQVGFGTNAIHIWVHFPIKMLAYKTVNDILQASSYTVSRLKEVHMAENFDPIDTLVRDVKRNAGFLNRLLFPRISLIVGIVGTLVALVLLLK